MKSFHLKNLFEGKSRWRHSEFWYLDSNGSQATKAIRRCFSMKSFHIQENAQRLIDLLFEELPSGPSRGLPQWMSIFNLLNLSFFERRNIPIIEIQWPMLFNFNSKNLDSKFWNSKFKRQDSDVLKSLKMQVLSWKSTVRCLRSMTSKAHPLE